MPRDLHPYDVRYVTRAGLGRVALALVELGGQLLDSARLPDVGKRPLYHLRVKLPLESEARFTVIAGYKPVSVARPALEVAPLPPLVAEALGAWEDGPGGESLEPLPAP